MHEPLFRAFIEAAREVEQTYGMTLSWAPTGRPGVGYEWDEDYAVVWNLALLKALAERRCLNA